MACLIGRQHLCPEFRNAQLTRHILRGACVIPGEHDDALDAALFEFADDVLRFRTQRIDDTEDADQLAALSHVEHRLPFGGQTLHVRQPRRHIHLLVFFHEVTRTDDDLLTVH